MLFLFNSEAMIHHILSSVTGIEALLAIVLFNMFCQEIPYVALYDYMMCLMIKFCASDHESILGYLRHYSLV